MPTVSSLDHIEIYVSDLTRTRAFWGWLLGRLGWQPYQDFGKGFSYRCGQTYLVFVQVEARHADLAFHRCRVGLNHLAFAAPDPESVDRLAQELLEKDVVILYADRHPHAGGKNRHAVYFEDPDRIKVEYGCAA